MNILTAVETVCFKWMNCTVWEYVSIKLLKSMTDTEQRPGTPGKQLRVTETVRDTEAEPRAPSSWGHRGQVRTLRTRCRERHEIGETEMFRCKLWTGQSSM